MKGKNKKAKFIIILIIFLMLILLLILQMLLVAIEREKLNGEADLIIGTNDINESSSTIQEIIEDSGSEYIKRTDNLFTKIYVDFKCDLYDDDGKSEENYFIDIIDQIANIEKNSFYLIDEGKKIEIYVYYDKGKDKYKVQINGLDDFYKETKGQAYSKILKTEIVPSSSFSITNLLYSTLQVQGMFYANTEIVTTERNLLQNGYYDYPSEHMKAKLAGGKVLNLVFDRNYEKSIGLNIFVKTKLEDIEEKYPNPSFGGKGQYFLGYRTDDSYIFLYEDEVSIYPYKYKANEYFDKYLVDYCTTGDLDKLVADFTTEWSSYFQFDYDKENQDLKLTFPSRGIDIDIRGNDSRGITIYNNYYLTDTVKELIKNNKITLKEDKDLLFITEQNRRESMN